MARPSETSLVKKNGTHKTDLVLERRKINEDLAKTAALPPKDFRDGVGSGVNNVVQGAVGAAGVAVLAPAVGMAYGARKGGVVGGVVGGVGGAVVGVVGAVGVAVSGAVVGIAKVGQGIAAAPRAVVARRRGKWYNEATRKWTKTNLEDAAEALHTVPEDDRDLLEHVQNEIDDHTEFSNSSSGEIVDSFYYDTLEIPTHADEPMIKRRYYLLARKYHPDRVGADQEAAEKFKMVAEAYQVLSDPELRAKYDCEGREGLSACKTSVAEGDLPHLDPSLLYSFVFGSDKFYDYVGRLATATAASVGDSNKVSLDDARKIQERRVTRLAIKLSRKINSWVESKKYGDGTSSIEAKWHKEGRYLTKASFGHELATTIGKIYCLVATEYEGTTGVSRWAAKHKAVMDKKSDLVKNEMEKLYAAQDLKRLRMDTKRKIAEVHTPEAKAHIEKEMEEKAATIMMRILWTTTVVDITSTLHEAARMVFYDLSADKETRLLRAGAVKKLGEIWMDLPEPSEAEDSIVMSTRNLFAGKHASTRQLYEEAAFDAMLETVRRRDLARDTARDQ